MTRVPVYESQQLDDSSVSQITEQTSKKPPRNSPTRSVNSPSHNSSGHSSTGHNSSGYNNSSHNSPGHNNPNHINQNIKSPNDNSSISTKKSPNSPPKMESSLTIRDYRLQPAAIVWENGAASGITKTHFIAMKSSLNESRMKSKRGYCSILGGASDTTGINPQKGSLTMKSTAAAKTGSNTACGIFETFSESFSQDFI